MDCRTPGVPVFHYPQEFAQTHVHWIGDVIQSSHLLSPPSPPVLHLSQSFPRSWLFASGGQSTGASASASVLSMNLQCWFPLGLIGLISLLAKGHARVFSSTTVQKHEFFCTQPSLWSNSQISTWPLEKPQLWLSEKWKWKSLSHVRLFGIPWSIQFMEFSRPKYWSG